MKKRFDAGAFFIFKTILFNNRLSVYKRYLEFAKKNGYVIVSMQEFWNSKEDNRKKFVLRHDVDSLPLKAVRKMFKIEKELGAHATYYFRHSTVDKILVQEILDAGFEVGLHFETISDWAESRNIEFAKNVDIEACREILRKEISDFKREYNPNMVSICSHGAPLNAKLHLSNNVLLECQNYKDFGIEFEAYDADLYNHYVSYHIMDTNIRNNNGFSYKSNPIDGISEQKQNIIFLAHPEHWLFSFKTWLKNLILFALGKFTLSTEREFVRIAKG